MGRFISYVFIFVCGFALCALILQRTTGTIPGLSRESVAARGTGDVSPLPDKAPPSRAPVAATGSLAGTTVVADAAAKVEPVVVNIDIEGTRRAQTGPFGFLQGGSEAFEGSGSGIILSSDGYVVTNNHVIEPVAERGTEGGAISVRLDNGKEYRDVTIVGRDPQSDLAVLKINGAQNLSAAVLGDSDKLRVGDWAIAVGNPLGFNSTVTLGIVSALNRRDFRVENDALDRVIQTDAAINPGNSGGALANISGEIIGINTAIASSTGASVGIGFAIPINSARRIIQQLEEKGRVTRPYLGVAFSPLDGVDRDTLPPGVTLPTDGQGALVVNRQGLGSAVVPGSPAATAGVRDFDVIRSIDGKPVRDINEVKEWVQQHDVGETVRLTLWRAGKTLEVPVKLQTMPSNYGLSPRRERSLPGRGILPFRRLPGAAPEIQEVP
ncbi:MAG: trypsin-like peptidase domain-containing protein [Cytophagales bacterium]|nr:trypsin-like peptidase domain-containing protein [Armatimonadota bacterium]